MKFLSYLVIRLRDVTDIVRLDNIFIKNILLIYFRVIKTHHLTTLLLIDHSSFPIDLFIKFSVLK